MIGFYSKRSDEDHISDYDLSLVRGLWLSDEMYINKNKRFPPLSVLVSASINCVQISSVFYPLFLSLRSAEISGEWTPIHLSYGCN